MYLLSEGQTFGKLFNNKNNSTVLDIQYFNKALTFVQRKRGRKITLGRSNKIEFSHTCMYRLFLLGQLCSWPVWWI